MEEEKQRKDRIVDEIEKVLKDAKLRTLTAEELAILLYHDIVGPEIETLRDHYNRLAYSFGSTH